MLVTVAAKVEAISYRRWATGAWVRTRNAHANGEWVWAARCVVDRVLELREAARLDPDGYARWLHHHMPPRLWEFNLDDPADGVAYLRRIGEVLLEQARASMARGCRPFETRRILRDRRAILEKADYIESLQGKRPPEACGR